MRTELGAPASPFIGVGNLDLRVLADRLQRIQCSPLQLQSRWLVQQCEIVAAEADLGQGSVELSLSSVGLPRISADSGEEQIIATHVSDASESRM